MNTMISAMNLDADAVNTLPAFLSDLDKINASISASIARLPVCPAEALTNQSKVDIEALHIRIKAGVEMGDTDDVSIALYSLETLLEDLAFEYSLMLDHAASTESPKVDSATVPKPEPVFAEFTRSEEDSVKRKFNTIKPMNISFACANTPAPLDFVFPGMLAGTVNGIVSAGGVGKSMFALQLSVLASGGIDMFDGQFGPAGVKKITILALEDPEIILQHRIHNIFKTVKDGYATEGWSPKNKLSAEAWSDNCRILPLCGTGFRIDDDYGYDRLCHYADKQQIVIIDTLRRCHSADENDNGEMSDILNKFERVATKTGATFILLHHVPKQNGITSSLSARGASSITDNMRYMATMRGLTGQEEKAMDLKPAESWPFVIYEPIKNNYCAPTGGFLLMKGPGGTLEYKAKIDDVISKAAKVPKGRGGRKYA